MLEVLGSRFADPDTVDAFSLLADGQNNAAIVTGGVLPRWTMPDAAQLPFALAIDDTKVARSGAGATTAQVLAAVAMARQPRSAATTTDCARRTDGDHRRADRSGRGVAGQQRGGAAPSTIRPARRVVLRIVAQ